MPPYATPTEPTHTNPTRPSRRGAAPPLRRAAALLAAQRHRAKAPTQEKRKPSSLVAAASPGLQSPFFIAPCSLETINNNN
jgi:hypothetical protein